MPKTLENESEKVIALLRVFRAASLSGDYRLRDAAASELRRYGISVVELPRSKPPEDQPGV